MAIKKLEGGRYKVDIRPHGLSGRRIQRMFDKKADAVAFENFVKTNIHNKEWLPKPSDHRRLSELQAIWWNYVGRNLKYSRKRNIAITRIVEALGDPRASQLTTKFLQQYASDRLFEGVKETTINREFSDLGGMFTVLIDSGEFHGENPLRSIKYLRKKVVEMAFLSTEDISRLLARLEGDERRITLLCLSTGARWGEATNVRAEHICNNVVTFVVTKNGKKRSVPLSDEAVRMIKDRESGLLFKVVYNSYRLKLKDVKPDLPKGQAIHVLRHTFAAHFMMNGGNILTLQRIMGHASLQQTLTYAHLAPNYLQDAVLYNPLQGNIHFSST